MIDKVAQGKRNKRIGANFELKTRKYFENLGWIVTKWQNNIDIDEEEIIKTGNHYIPGKGLTMGKGFPDFLMLKNTKNKQYKIQFVECKTNNKLDKKEKQKMQVLKEMGHDCFVAYLENGDVMLRSFKGYAN